MIGIGEQNARRSSPTRTGSGSGCATSAHRRLGRAATRAASAPRSTPTWRPPRTAGARVLLGFGHSRVARRARKRCRRRALPPRVPALPRALPAVATYLTWNEANHCSQPTCHRPERAAATSTSCAATARAARSSPPTCSTRRRCRAVAAAVRARRQAPAADLGAAQLHRRQPLPHARDAGAAATRPRRRSGSPRPAASSSAQRLDDRVRRTRRAHAAQATQLGVPARPPEPARPARLRLPLDRAGARAPPGTRRCSTATAGRGPAYDVAAHLDRAPRRRAAPRARPLRRRRACASPLAAAAVAAPAGCGESEGIARRRRRSSGRR